MGPELIAAVVGGLAGFLTVIATEIVKYRLGRKAEERERRRKAWETSIDATRRHCRNMLDWFLRGIETTPVADANELLLGDLDLYEAWQTAVVEKLHGGDISPSRAYELRDRVDRELDEQMERANRDEALRLATVSARAAELGEERVRLGEQAWVDASLRP